MTALFFGLTPLMLFFLFVFLLFFFVFFVSARNLCVQMKGDTLRRVEKDFVFVFCFFSRICILILIAAEMLHCTLNILLDFKIRSFHRFYF